MKYVTAECINCGHKHPFLYNSVNVLDLVETGWRANTESSLLCPACFKVKPAMVIPGRRNIMFVIDRIADKQLSN